VKALICTCPKKGCAIHDAPVKARRYPWQVAEDVAEEISRVLRDGCERIEIAGSLRRRKSDVGDIEILYIPKIIEAKREGSLFGETDPMDCAALIIEALVETGRLTLRLNVNTSHTYGPLNKLMLHVASGIPVDLFAATHENWFNYLVCRTGPAELNTRIASAAKRIGWKWHPYSFGFTALDNGQEARMESEEDVFNFVGLPYADPEARGRDRNFEGSGQ
jgi:DNA polymerase/3'-5' exonuclease PolX